MAPVHSSWTASAAAGNYIGGTVTYTATVYTYDATPSTSQVGLVFQYNAGGGPVTFGTGIPDAVYTGTVGGQTVYYHPFHLTATNVASDQGNVLLGYTATDNVTNLHLTWFSSTSYSTFVSGGGGGGGCPALDMFLDEWHQVADAFVGMGLDTIADEGLLAEVSTETREVLWMDESEEECYRIVAENGAEVVVSASTPVPTRETALALADGARPARSPSPRTR